MKLEMIAQIVNAIIFCIGFGLVISGLLDFVHVFVGKAIKGRVVDFAQEYTSRGFLWKAKVEYELNGTTHFYVTRSRTLKRGSDNITLYVNESGKVVELNYAFEKAALGCFIIFIAFVVWFVI